MPTASQIMLTVQELDAIRQFDTCTIADAIERLGVRLRNEGFTRPGLRCFTQEEPRLLGYAATFRIRSSDPPVTGRAFLERNDWWEDLLQLPSPRIAVILDMEPAPVGSCVGEVHSAVFKALGCEGVITNGAVRDLPAVKRLDFPLFARSIAVSHAYTHVVEFGGVVEILGLEVHHGDLLYADCHGVIEIPIQLASSVANAAAQIRAEQARILERCRSLDIPISSKENREKLMNIIGSEQ